MIIDLPYPPPELLPNKSRTRHWGKNSGVAAKYKEDCKRACRDSGAQQDWCPDIPLMVELTYHRHDNRHADLDNLLAATKSGIDALSDYIDLDDKHFEYTIRRGEVMKPSIVRVVI